MTTEEESLISRTTGSRMGKGVAVIVIVMAIGAGIHMAFSAEWFATPPPVTARVPDVTPPDVVTPTGVTHEIEMRFVESSDLRTLGFDALPGEEGANPDIEVNVGDTVVVHMINAGVMPHSFGVVTDPMNVNTIVFNSAIGSATDPLLRGQDGTVTFMPTREGEFYYICTVPGHAAQGMMGKFIVKKAEGAPAPTVQRAEPTGVSHTFDLDFIESSDFRVLGFDALPGEEGANPEIRVKAGDQVTINVVNKGAMPHSFGVVTDPENVNSMVFNSAIGSASNPVLRNQSGSVTFIADRPGLYHYICTVPGHAAQGMHGMFIVE